MNLAKVLVAGEWRESQPVGEFAPENPAMGESLGKSYPVSSPEEVLAAISAGAQAADALWDADTSTFLDAFADAIEANADKLVEIAHEETGLPKAPRLKDVELPRTTNQLRQAAAAARDGAWRQPVRDEGNGIYALRAPLGGPVVVFGPNNFPFAFNGISGGDFAAAIASRNPVIAKANPGHPGTSEVLAQIAFDAVLATGLHPSTVQMIYEMPRETGLELVSHPLIGATAFTGSRTGGLKLKEAADRAGKPIYLEMSSINPVVFLQGALREKGEALADALFTSCTMGSGQFCTSPGLVVIPDNETFVEASRQRFAAGAPGQLLGCNVRNGLNDAVSKLQSFGANLLAGGTSAEPGYGFQPTLFTISARAFLAQPGALQEEAFGPVTLLVTAKDTEEIIQVLQQLEGNLTGSIYSAEDGSDDDAYANVERVLRRRVGRLLNDKMPTGVAVSPAMVHGGPFPASGHPGFTAVGIPASIERFTVLHCYDNVRRHRLPTDL